MENLFEHHGNFHLMGDSTKWVSYEAVMNNEKAQMVYADPPYCLLIRKNKKTGQRRDPKKAKINHEAVTRYENIKEYRTFCEKWMEPALSFLKDEGVFVVWTNFLGKKPIKETAKKIGLEYFYGEFLWGKLTKESSGNESLARLYEVALVFSKVPPKKLINSDFHHPWSIITHYDEEKEAEKWGGHPNHKPYSALAPLIRSYTSIGDRILDPFTGSGSTPEATINLERKSSGIELRPKWAQMTQQRIQKIK